MYPNTVLVMAPTSKRREKNKTIASTRRIVTRSVYKKQQLLMSQEESSSKIVECSSLEDEVPSTTSKGFDDGSSTPKSQKYKIPEILTCPPAPKKTRVSPSNSWLVQRRRPIAFFAHPDLDKFFMFAIRDHIKV